MELLMKSRKNLKEVWKKEHPHYFVGQYVPPPPMSEFYGILLQIAGTTVEVETEYLFEDQFNTAPIPNVSKGGMRIMASYVEKVIGDERPGKARCQWCGKTSTDTSMCSHCEKTEYLTIF